MRPWRPARRAALVARLRWVLAAALVLAAAASAVRGHRAEAVSATPVLVAAHDLAGGHVLIPGDVRTVPYPRARLPAGALRPGDRPAGRTVAGPVRAGEVLTDVRLLGAPLLAAYGPGLVATPVRIADAGAVRLLRSGDRVDVLATPARNEGAATPPRKAETLVSAAPVVSVPPPDPSGPGEGGALVLLATTPETATRLAAANSAGVLSVVVRGR